MGSKGDNYVELFEKKKTKKTMSCTEIKPDETQKPSGQEYLALKFTMLKFEAKCHW